MKIGSREIVLIALIGIALFAMFQITGEESVQQGDIRAGAKSVDLELIQRKIKAGELSSHEAEFYRQAPVEPPTGNEAGR